MGRYLWMAERTPGRQQIAVLDNPENGQTLPALAVVEEFVRRGNHVTYVTTSEIAARLSLLGATGEAWSVVGLLDDSMEPAASLRGYFLDDRPDLIVYFANASTTAGMLLSGWRVEAFQLADATFGHDDPGPDAPLGDDFLAGMRLSLVPHGLAAPLAWSAEYE